MRQAIASACRSEPRIYLLQIDTIDTVEAGVLGGDHAVPLFQSAEYLYLLDVATADFYAPPLRGMITRRQHENPVATGLLQEGPGRQNECVIIAAQGKLSLHRLALHEAFRVRSIKSEVNDKLPVLYLRINADDMQAPSLLADVHVRHLAVADPGQVVLIHVGGKFDAGIGRDLGQALTGIAVLAHLDIHVRQTPGNRCAHGEVVELGVDDTQVFLQLLELRLDERNLALANRVLTLVARGLQRLELQIVVELVLNDVPRLLGFSALGEEHRAPVDGSGEARDVVIELGQRPLVIDFVQLEIDFVLLQLSSRLIELRFLLDDLELQVGVAEADERLAFLHLVTRLGEDSFYAPTVDGVDIDGVVGHHLAAQGNKIVIDPFFHGRNGERTASHADRALGIAEEGGYGEKHQPKCQPGANSGTDSHRPLRPMPWVTFDLLIHAGTISEFEHRHRRYLIAHGYSYLSAAAGCARATSIACPATVARAITSAMMLAPTKIKGSRPT